MKAVIHQALGDVLGGGGLERAQVEDAFVRDEAVAAVERREMLFEPLGSVIRVEDGELRGGVDGKSSRCFGSTTLLGAGEKVAKPDEVNKLSSRNRSQGNKIPCSANESKINREPREPREMNCRNRTQGTQNGNR